MDVHLYIQNDKTVYEPVVQGSISWETKRKGQPGKCCFTLIPDSHLKIEEGNAVRLDVKGQPVFFGFIFERSWNCDGQMQITAYDQLRYLKNKETYNYTDLTASQLIRMIAGDFHLRTGELEDTVCPLSRKEKDKTLFDIILNALDATMLQTKKLFTLYDDVGKLTLKNMENMKLDIAIMDTTAMDYDYKVSIDSNTYNQIKIYRDQNSTRELYMTKNTENINKWGVLQMNESLQNGADGQLAAETYLALYNRPSNSLSIKEAFGDIRVRAGCLIPVFLDIQDMKLKNYLVVEAVNHKIDTGIHTMDLTLRGAGISG